MITINEIYNWYNDYSYHENRPEAPNGMTPLQRIEWREQNQKKINDFEDYLILRNNKTFVGELLVGAPAFINWISKESISADAFYEYSFDSEIIEHLITPYPSSVYNTSLVDYFESKYQNRIPYFILQIKYNIRYNVDFYETVKLIHDNSKVEIEGQILKFEKKNYKYYHMRTVGPMLDIDIKEGNEIAYEITLQLTAIKNVMKVRITDDLLKSEKKREQERQVQISKDEEKSAADKANLDTAYRNSIIWGIIGGFLGWVAGSLIGSILKFLSSNSINGDNIKSNTIILLIIIFAVLGAYFGFLTKRKPQPDWPGRYFFG